MIWSSERVPSWQKSCRVYRRQWLPPVRSRYRKVLDVVRIQPGCWISSLFTWGSKQCHQAPALEEHDQARGYGQSRRASRALMLKVTDRKVHVLRPCSRLQCRGLDMASWRWLWPEAMTHWKLRGKKHGAYELNERPGLLLWLGHSIGRHGPQDPAAKPLCILLCGIGRNNLEDCDWVALLGRDGN